MMDERSHEEITEVGDVSVPNVAHGEITEVEDVSVPGADCSTSDLHPSPETSPRTFGACMTWQNEGPEVDDTRSAFISYGSYGDGNSRSPVLDGDGDLRSSVLNGDGDSRSPVLDGDGDSRSPVLDGDGNSRSPVLDGDGDSRSPVLDGDGDSRSSVLEVFRDPETSKDVDPRWTDWIHTLSRLNKLSEALLPAEVNPFKAKEAEKSRESADVHPMPGSDVTVAHCSCQIDSAVEKEWKRSLYWGACTKLMELLKKHPCLLAITGSDFTRGEGDTVLHVAAREGNLKLLVYTCSLFLDDLGHPVKEYVHGDKIDRKAFFSKKNDDQLTAKDCLWFTLAGTTMYKYFDNFMKFGTFEVISSNATLAAMQDEVFNPFYDNYAVRKRLDDCADGTYIKDNGGVDARRRMKEVIIREFNDRKEQLDKFRPGDCDTDDSDTDDSGNLIAEYEELRFLHTLSERAMAKSHRLNAEKEEYLRAVIRGCVEEGPDVVKYLFSHRNFKGQTAFHCADAMDYVMLIEEIPPGEEYKDCFNARDSRGWTALHCAAAQGQVEEGECLLKDSRVDVNAPIHVRLNAENLIKENGMRFGSALHLAIMHNHMNFVKMLLRVNNTNINILHLIREFTFGGFFNFLTPLQLAVFLGRHEMIKVLLHHPKVKDPGLQKEKSVWPIGVQLCQNANEEKSNLDDPSKLSAIHVAGLLSDPKTLRCFLNISDFNLSVTIRGRTALHFLVDGNPPWYGRYFREEHFHDDDDYAEYLRSPEEKGPKSPSDKDREACIAILIQAGMDVWQKDEGDRFPEPGPFASPEVSHFWQQKLLSETQDAKNNLNDAGNAVSIVSALVATASYVGPLQPPLGLDSNFVQDQNLPIRVYMVTNTISFYMAVASIMFAVVPSLPMPQEGLYEEWQRSRKTIIVAIHLLLLAVMNILISFGAASNVVVSSEYSWQHKGLVFYPTLLGGSLCILAILLFYLRLLRLAFVKNSTIKRIYHGVYRAT